MKLFGVKRIHTHVLLSNLFFDSKIQAKIARDKLNAEDPGAYHVAPGPDHHKHKHNQHLQRSIAQLRNGQAKIRSLV